MRCGHLGVNREHADASHVFQPDAAHPLRLGQIVNVP